MAYNFTPDLPVLNFGPRHHVRWSSRQFLLWPVWAYRVVAPRIRNQKCNVLQRAIIGLARAGVYRPDDISNLLSIHTSLAEFIISELKHLKLLDRNGFITESGLRAIEEDAIEDQDLVAGYVFQDPWTGEIWPRFVEKLGYCELEYNDQGYPILLFGTVGKPKRDQAFTVIPRKEVIPLTPSPSAIVQAAARHRKGFRFKDADDSDEDSFANFPATSVQINRVCLIEQEPKPFFLTTYLYIPDSQTDSIDWYVCDPFGFGRSVRLRRRIESIINDIPGLYDVISRIAGKTAHSSQVEQRRRFEEIKFFSGVEVDRKLSVNFRSHPAFDNVLAMELARQEVRILGSECPEHKINETLRAGSKVLEAFFASMTATHPIGDAWKQVYVSKFNPKDGTGHLACQQDRHVLSATYENAFLSLGFSPPFPRSLLNVKPGQIRAVAEFNDNWRLRPLITATALAAYRDTTHPFSKAAKRSPNLLDCIDEVASAGGKAGHANGESPSIEDLERITDEVYHIASVIIGLAEFDDVIMNSTTGGDYNEQEEQEQ